MHGCYNLNIWKLMVHFSSKKKISDSNEKRLLNVYEIQKYINKNCTIFSLYIIINLLSELIE